MNTLAPSFSIGSSSFLQLTKDNYEILDEFAFQLDLTTDYGVSCAFLFLTIVYLLLCLVRLL